MIYIHIQLIGTCEREAIAVYAAHILRKTELASWLVKVLCKSNLNRLCTPRAWRNEMQLPVQTREVLMTKPM